MTPDLHAAWTDAVLAVASFGGAAFCGLKGPRRWMAPAGLVLVGAAALVGTARLGGVVALADVHDGLSRLAGLVGVPLIGAGVIAATIGPAVRSKVTSRVAVLAVVLCGVVWMADADTQRSLRTLVAGGAMVGALLASLRSQRWTGAVGAAGVVLAGLVVAGDGDWLGFPRDGWFHLAMACSVAGLAFAARPHGETA